MKRETQSVGQTSLLHSPLTHPSADRLGHARLAELLAKSILSVEGEEGRVIAINGPWGSGKTTFRNFVISFLKPSETSERVPVVLNFNPWWTSGSEDITRQFFDALADRLIEEKFPKQITDRIYKLGRALGKITFADNIKIAMAAMSAASSLYGNSAEIRELKEFIASELRIHKRRVLVTIDDIDRLFPKDLVELFRVINVLSDLPLLTFLLLFDKKAITKVLSSELKVAGQDYLEKIVNLQFPIPALDKDSFDLQFREKLRETFTADAIDGEYLNELYETGLRHFLTNPRRGMCQ